jgi:hypothetical protein
MWWPRCGFKFYSQDSPGLSGRRWRICNRAWGHWFGANSPHMGPLVTDENHDLGKEM